MSDAEVIETTGAEEVEKPAEAAKEAPKPSRADWEARQVERASKSGWKDFDAYIEEGGDPDKWKTADAFNIYGELIGTVRRKEQEFEQRLEGVQRMSQAQLAAQREQLMAKREEVMEIGGTNVVKEVKAIEKQIQALDQPATPARVPEVDRWNAENPWILEDTPKAAYAIAQWNKILAKQLPYGQALEELEGKIKAQYPPASQKQATIPESERGNGAKGFGNKTTKSLTMSDLNDEEKLAWKAMGHAWKSEKEFLQSALDMRNATKGGK